MSNENIELGFIGHIDPRKSLLFEVEESGRGIIIFDIENTPKNVLKYEVPVIIPFEEYNPRFEPQKNYINGKTIPRKKFKRR